MKPVRNPGYLRWIRTLPCSVCRTTRAVEAAHTSPHGLGQKSSDLSVIPKRKLRNNMDNCRGITSVVEAIWCSSTLDELCGVGAGPHRVAGRKL
jgi:hypothetical protein